VHNLQKGHDQYVEQKWISESSLRRLARKTGAAVGKSVVVTGSNSGIGLATALELGRAGYDVYGTVRSQAKARSLTEAAQDKGVSVTPVVCDVGDADSCAAGFAEIAEQTGGGPWAVINNAGYAQPGAVEDVSDELARRQLEVNLLTPARVARLVLPGMRERGEGRIVNISSVAGRISSPLTGWYSASKFGLEALTDALRVEVAPFGVKVSLVEPGGAGTEIWSRMREGLPDPQDTAYTSAYARAMSATAHGGLLPDPIWVARVIRLCLASPLPLPRYLVGIDAVSGVLAEHVTPTVVSDFVKGMALGLKKVGPKNVAPKKVGPKKMRLPIPGRGRA
jgi:NAD(P)-dependent dehydrogenase (short-subunit alcohol dehydrogenase family)